MPPTLQIKRRTGSSGAPSLLPGELMYNEPEQLLRIGLSSSGMVTVGGLGVLSGYAQLASPALSGTPTAPTPSTSDNSTSIATTAFVKAQNYAPLASPIFSGTPTAPTPLASDNSTLLATTAFVKAQNYAVAGAITGGTFTKVTVASSGLVTLGATLAVADIPTLDHSKISDFDTQVRTSRLDQLAAPTAPVSLNSQKITGLADPVNPQEAATKSYVDATAQGLAIKSPCQCASTADLVLSGLQTIDGYAVQVNDRVLVKNQTAAAQNGLYVASSGAWARSADMNGAAEFYGAFTFVETGTANAATSWVCTTPPTIVVGTTALTFAQFGAAGGYTASGNGVYLSGNNFYLTGVANRISLGASGIDISSSYAGQTSITTLGTISAATIDCGVV